MERLFRIYGYGLLAFFISMLALSSLNILVLIIIPIFAILTIKYRRDVMMTLLIYSLLMIINYEPIVSLMFIFSYAGFGILLGYLVTVRQSAFKSIMTSTVYIFISSLIGLFSIGIAMGKNPFELFNQAIAEQNVEAFKGLEGYIADIVSESVLGIYFVFALIMATVFYYIIKVIVRYKYKEEIQSIKFFRIEGFSFIQLILFIIILTLFKLYDTQFGGYIFYGSIIALLSILLWQGFSVIYWFMNKYIKNKYISFIIAFYTAFIFITPLVGIIVGLNDLIYNFRKV